MIKRPTWLIRPIRINNTRNLREFIFRLLAQQYCVKMLVGFVAAIFLPEAFESKGQQFNTHDPAILAFTIVIFAPIIETLLLQTALIEICRAFKWPITIQFCAGMIPFTLLHFPFGVIVGLAAGVVGGCYFSYTYLECRRNSWWRATGVTMILHSLHNLIVLPVILMAGG